MRVLAVSALVLVSLFVLEGAAPLDGSTPEEREARLMALIDPANGPPLRDPAFKPHDKYAALGSPGGYFPERAQRLGVPGVSILVCEVATLGKLDKCAVLDEFPIGFGFGDAARRMADEGYMTAIPVAGAPDGQLARIIAIFPKPPTDLRAH